MTAADVYRTIIEDVVGLGDVELAGKLFADDFVAHRTGLHTSFALLGGPPPAPGAELPGKRRFLQGLSRIKASFPDWSCTIHHCVADTELVAGAFTVSGSFTGSEPFLGLPPNGRRFAFEEAGILRIRDGQAVEGWFVGDELAFVNALTDLGLNA
ncbi:putative ester cyclase [Streptomyces aurantiacus]|uniref:ester cyclase n=1 Tax=Streptomyces aurantiacus TaxID=47760 RepID=UPI0027942549|nr:ester cyclase [Streptomyces aurantiacus]MDQ0778816.1 putative ester cyclase [Streptomyces aurantiacus]